MKPIVIVVAIFIAVSAFGTPVCAPDTAADYIKAGSCTEDPFILKDFAWSSVSGGNFVKVTPDQVFLTPASTQPRG